MKCEVCGCRISRKDIVCPNCGFVLRKVTPTKGKSFIKKNKKTEKKNKVKNIGKKYLIVLSTALIGLLLLVLSIPKNIEDLSIDEILKSGRDDQYTTVQIAKEYRNDLIKDLEGIGFKDIFIAERVDKNENVLTVSSVVNMKKEIDNTDHLLFYGVHAGKINHLIYEGNSDVDNFTIDELNKISDILGYENMNNILNKIDIQYKDGYFYEDDILTIRIDESDEEGMFINYKIVGHGFSEGV